MITPDTEKLIETWRLGYIASADESGRVNLSPKGTFVVLDATHIAFAEMRSPQTLANIAVRPDVEINFVDILSRKGVRMRGDAQTFARGADMFDEILPAFTPLWPDLVERFNAVVRIALRTVKPLTTPAYDAGATEPELRAMWKAKIEEMPA